MHERHRSPFASPSRSPCRSSKCPRNKRLRMARRSIRARAKHRVGLERPHFCTQFRGQSDAWVAPAHEIPFDVLPAGAAEFWTKQVLDEVDSGEDGKNYGLHFHHCQLLHSMLGLRNWFSSLCNYRLCESHRAKKVKSALRANAYREAALGSPENLSDNMSDICTNKKGEASCPF